MYVFMSFHKMFFIKPNKFYPYLSETVVYAKRYTNIAISIVCVILELYDAVVYINIIFGFIDDVKNVLLF